MLRFQGNLLKFVTPDIVDVVVSRQRCVHERVIGIDKTQYAFVFVQQMIEKTLRLLPHGGFKIIGIVRLVVRRIRWHLAKLSDPQPLPREIV